eukprot:TRINITY_DN1182_c4_g1_i1.p1 TRINITY_DN1182_c4_g1~~TRINITY_DN1182_c4_g1_i1.p1  ORF type:complete len:284 (+),score=38.02 TRINITY_DN1182_c4_g1_i1:83-934(+)
MPSFHVTESAQKSLESVLQKVTNLNNTASVILTRKLLPAGGSHAVFSRSVVESYKEVLNLLLMAEGAVLGSCFFGKSAVNIHLDEAYRLTELMIALMDLWIGDSRRAGVRLQRLNQNTSPSTLLSTLTINLFIGLVTAIALLTHASCTTATRITKETLSLTTKISALRQGDDPPDIVIEQIASLSNQILSNCSRVKGDRLPSRWIYSLDAIQMGLFAAFTDFVNIQYLSKVKAASLVPPSRGTPAPPTDSNGATSSRVKSRYSQAKRIAGMCLLFVLLRTEML